MALFQYDNKSFQHHFVIFFRIHFYIHSTGRMLTKRDSWNVNDSIQFPFNAKTCVCFNENSIYWTETFEFEFKYFVFFCQSLFTYFTWCFNPKLFFFIFRAQNQFIIQLDWVNSIQEWIRFGESCEIVFGKFSLMVGRVKKSSIVWFYCDR